MRSVVTTFVVATLLCALMVPALQASGFSIFEQSAKASGMAGAFVAGADDAAAAWYNPAAMLWLDGKQVQFGINAITVGGDTDMTVLDPAFGIFTPVKFSPESSIETPIHLYYTQKINEGWAWGLAITTPFGLVSEWTDRPITYSAAKSELLTVVINPSVAVRIAPAWSLAVGIDYMYADLKEFSREVPIDLDGNPFNGFEVIGFTNLSGDGDEWSWNIALHHEGPVKMGLTYRAGFDPKLSGELTFEDFGPLQPFFRDTTGGGALPLPEQAAFGVGWNLNTAWFMELDVTWTGWSTFEALEIEVDNRVPGFVEDIFLEENWDDTFSYRMGLAFDSSAANQWRFGVVYDESPIPPEFLRPSIPDADRLGLSFGWGHTGNKVDWDLYYMALWFDDITAIPGEDGVIGADYSSFANLAGLTVSYNF